MQKIYPQPLLPANWSRHGGLPNPTPDVIDFSVSLNPLGPPECVYEVLRDPRSAALHYPDPDQTAIREAVARHHGIGPEEVLIGNGAAELIHLIPRSLFPDINLPLRRDNPPLVRIALAEPTFTEYHRTSRRAGTEHWRSSDDDFAFQPFPLDDVDLVWICNPNNPTGNLWPGADLEKWIARERKTLFVVDEAFMPFVARQDEHSLIPALLTNRNLIILRSLTKFFAIPGLRLGYALGPPELLAKMKQHQPPWSVNALAAAVGPHLLADTAYAERSVRFMQSEAAWLFAELHQIPALHPFEPAANFILVRIDQGASATALASLLAEEKIIIRLASNFITLDDRYFRIAVRSREDNQKLLTALQKSFNP